MRTPNPYRLLSRQDVEDEYCIPKRFLERAGSAGPASVRFGGYVRYRVCDIEAWLEANVSQQDAPPCR